MESVLGLASLFFSAFLAYHFGRLSEHASGMEKSRNRLRTQVRKVLFNIETTNSLLETRNATFDPIAQAVFDFQSFTTEALAVSLTNELKRYRDIPEECLVPKVEGGRVAVHVVKALIEEPLKRILELSERGGWLKSVQSQLTSVL